jgi:aspartate carbamoyltransferase catalytic subunit
MILNTQNLNNQLISVNDFSINDIGNIFNIAKSQDFKTKNPGLLVSIFFENSTRTLLSFEKASINCGFNYLNFNPYTSSLSKEETEINTIRTLRELNPAVVVVRCKHSGEPQIFKKYLSQNTILINAGDGTNEHPTQALLDAFTIFNTFDLEFTENCFKGLEIAIMGDIMHSRVARSNIFLLSRLGAQVTLISPPNFLNQNFIDFYTKNYNAIYKPSYEGKFDVVMLLRVQKERMEGGGKICYPSKFGIFTEKELNGAHLMHPGPINVGVEVSEDLAYNSTKSLISKQVENGVLIRSAIINYLSS